MCSPKMFMINIDTFHLFIKVICYDLNTHDDQGAQVNVARIVNVNV